MENAGGLLETGGGEVKTFDGFVEMDGSFMQNAYCFV